MESTRKVRIEQEVARKTDEIASIDEAFFGDVMGIAQASGQLREALDKLDSLIDTREYEKAANLGYTDIASEFIFLQRCLGALKDSCMSKSALVSETIVEIGLDLDRPAYEEVDPFVTEKMKSMQPRKSNKDPDRNIIREALIEAEGKGFDSQTFKEIVDKAIERKKRQARK